jgi:hypothetical protein
MFRIFLLCCSVLFTSLICSPAFAIFKCEAGGKITYSDAPCQGEVSSELRAVPAIPAADQKRARDKAQADKAALARIEGARQKDEVRNAYAVAQAGKMSAAHKKKCDALEQQVKWREDDLRHAEKPKSIERSKRSLQRARDKYHLDCGR